MLPQELAVEKITASLKKDPLVKAIFLKGSMGRGEHDEHSDVDLYCLVNEEDKEEFLANRVKHLQAYRDIILMDDIFIVAPQIIAVFDDLLHIDLFTVTKESFVGGDIFEVLYDPHHLMDEFMETQGLALTEDEYRDDVLDVGWFLFQYSKSAARGNDIWSVRMLTNVVHHLGTGAALPICTGTCEVRVEDDGKVVAGVSCFGVDGNNGVHHSWKACAGSSSHWSN